MQDLFYFTVFLFCIGFMWFLLPYFVRKIQTYHLKLKCAQKRAIVLTFDDGPSKKLTPRILDYLAQHNVQATFFLLGSRAEENPKILAKIVAGNHGVGSHSYKHLNAWRSLPLANLKDILQGAKAISPAVKDNTLFRPPYGKTTLLSLLFILFSDLKVSWWTIDPKDSLEKPTSHQYVLDQIRKNNGGVVLLHDWDEYPSPEHDIYVISLVEKIITMAKAEGYTFATVSEV